jgi:hypothetical protein
MEATLNLYKAKMDLVGELLTAQKSYIGNTKQRYADEESALESKWDSQDRAESKAEIEHQLEIYKGAVTEKGMEKYKSLQEELKEINREEEMLALQKKHTESLNDMEESYSLVENNKKYLLASIEDSGLNIESLVNSVNYDIQSMENTVTGLFKDVINTIKSINISSSSYSDNRNISISGNSADIIDALKNRVALTLAHGSYN